MWPLICPRNVFPFGFGESWTNAEIVIIYLNVRMPKFTNLWPAVCCFLAVKVILRLMAAAPFAEHFVSDRLWIIYVFARPSRTRLFVLALVVISNRIKLLLSARRQRSWWRWPQWNKNTIPTCARIRNRIFSQIASSRSSDLNARVRCFCLRNLAECSGLVWAALLYDCLCLVLSSPAISVACNGRPGQNHNKRNGEHYSHKIPWLFSNVILSEPLFLSYWERDLCYSSQSPCICWFARSCNKLAMSFVVLHKLIRFPVRICVLLPNVAESPFPFYKPG